MTKRVKKKKPTIILVKQPEVVKIAKKIINPTIGIVKTVISNTKILATKNIQVRKMINNQDNIEVQNLPIMIDQLYGVREVDITTLENILEIGTMCFVKRNLYFYKDCCVSQNNAGTLREDGSFCIPINTPVMYAGKVKYKFKSSLQLTQPVVQVCYSFYADGIQFIPRRILRDLVIPEYNEKTLKK